MNKSYPLSTRSVRKGSLMLIIAFLFAACMQHDESLAPQDLQNRGLSQGNAEANEKGSMMKRTFTAHLNSSNEVNPEGVISEAQGQAIFTLSEDGMSLHYKLIVANIEDVIVSHIHCGPAGVNGPPAVFLFGPEPDGVDVNGILAEGDITNIGRPVGEASNCSGGLMTFDDLIEHLRNGTSYVNVHTKAYPGGEIRGQIM